MEENKSKEKGEFRIYIDGACSNNNVKDTTLRKAGYGIFLLPPPADGNKFLVPFTPAACASSSTSQPFSSGENTKGEKGGKIPDASDVNKPLPAREECFFVAESMEGTEEYPLTNNRAEIMSAVRALQMLVEERFPVPRGAQVVFINDSKYVHSAVTDWLPRLWKPNDYKKSDGGQVLNVDLIMRLDFLSESAQKMYNLRWERMNSHQKEPLDKNSHAWRDWFGNDRADKLACLACGKTPFLKPNVGQKRKGKEEKEEEEKSKKIKK